ncbi:hypothetical protein EDD16DRAFT_1636822 [Pisolithus croceorrhizus]|nr:hypothetical protein EDD16DRAFT_1636822 [Pisolithus croceorrhizus]
MFYFFLRFFSTPSHSLSFSSVHTTLPRPPHVSSVCCAFCHCHSLCSTTVLDTTLIPHHDLSKRRLTSSRITYTTFNIQHRRQERNVDLNISLVSWYSMALFCI